MEHASMKYRVRVNKYRDPDSLIGPQDKYFERYEDARIEYTHCQLDQIMECKYIEEIRLEVADGDGVYRMVFASLHEHPAAAY